MKKRFALPVFVYGTLVISAFCSSVDTWGKTAAPLFHAFVIYSKASDHIVMSTRAKSLIQQMGVDNNFTADFTTDTSLINDTNLAKYQLFIQLHLAPFEMSAKQQAAFEKFIGQGKGWVGIHGAGLTGSQFILPTTTYWQWYETFFGGVVYSPHPAYQRGTVIMEDRTHPATKNMPATWQVWDEWYEFNKSPRPNVHVLGKADETTYTQTKPMGDHPIIWSNEHYNNRMIYIGIGHDSSVCGNPSWVTLFHDAVMWAGAMSTAVKVPGASAAWPLLMNNVTIRVDKGSIAVNAPAAGSITATLIDANGKTRCGASGVNGICRIERRHLSKGIYFVRVSTQKGVFSQRLSVD